MLEAPGAGIPCGCGLPGMAAGNQTLAVYRSLCSGLLNHLSKPRFQNIFLLPVIRYGDENEK